MGFLKKNFFWIANFLLTAAMIGVWFYSTGAITKATSDRVGTIKSKVNAAKAVNNVSAEEGANAHPNQTTEDGMKVKLDTLAESITRAWTTRFESQQQIMQWPESILFGDAGRAFRKEFEKFDPPEILPAENTGKSEQMKILLQVYKQQIPAQMDTICSIIKSDWHYQELLDAAAKDDESDATKDPDASADSDDGESDEEEKRKQDREEAFQTGRQIVSWSEVNQNLWYRKLTSFQGRDDNEFSVNLPTPSQVYMLQQDLWLLQAMFEIIREVNAQRDADGKVVVDEDGNPVLVAANDLAAIKHIDHVVFGREALALLGTITDTMQDTTQKGAGGLGGGRGGGSRAGGRSRGGKNKSSDESFAYRGQPAFHGRYVNSNLEPSEADTIRKVLSDKNLPSNDLEVVVAKRVPVRFAVKMDERKIADFLAACANSPFAFEVWQVRINRHDGKEVIKLRGSEGAAGGGGRGGGRGGIGSLGGATGPSGGFGSTGGSGGKSGSSVIAVRDNFDVRVEFYGIVKIYNPVNETCLGRDASDAAQP